MAPTVAKAASWGETPSGTATQRLTGTQLSSAWSANSLPAHATSWPRWNSSAPARPRRRRQPTSSRAVCTSPAGSLPYGKRSVAPVAAPVSRTFLSWSGRARALPMRDILDSPTFMSSVPAEISEYRERTRTPPGEQDGGRHLDNRELAGLVILRYLLHRLAISS